MHELDKEKFGAFLARRRKERGLTQKELARHLFVSDKAVSKWERGLSMPDVALLTPLSEQLGVTVTELLRGQETDAGERMEAEEVDRLMEETIRLSAAEQESRTRERSRWRRLYPACVLAVLLELLGLRLGGFDWGLLASDLFLVEGLCLVFGGWVCLFAQERLPHYYDQYKISQYSDGFFRMNVPGVYFNNSNWPHILRALRVWLVAVPVAFPLLYGALQSHLPQVWAWGRLALTLTACLGELVLVVVVGRRYQ